MKRALITGIAGFAGSHLAEYLLSEGISVFGFYHPKHSISNIDHLIKNIQLIKCDVFGENDLAKKLQKINPDFIFHLAAFSSPAESYKNPKDTLENNIIGELNLLEGLVKIKSKAKILIVGSADEYGNNSKDLPLDEKTPLAPISPYAVSKVAQDMLGLQFYIHYKLNIIRVRPFNHIGPRQSHKFVVSSFAQQIAYLERNRGSTIKVGNLDTWRDFTDVRDMVRAYKLALDRGITGEVYNIGSGNCYKIEDILNILLSFSKVKIEIKKDKGLKRDIDIQRIVCNYSKFKNQTGWKPMIPLSKTLSDTIEYERSKLR